MIRISKLTDYGIALLTHFARHGMSATLSARQLAEDSAIPLPTVGKLLKILLKAELLESQRGINGGYRLKLPPEKISAARIISALEGPIAISDCTHQAGRCGRERDCPVRESWFKINRVVLSALDNLSLGEMSQGESRKDCRRE